MINDTNSNNGNESSSYSQCAYKMATIVGPSIVAYLVAPYLSLAARAVFPAAYTIFVGTPSTFAYYTQYVPAREYVCNQVYNNAHVIVGATITGAHLVVEAASVATEVAAKTVSAITRSSVGFFSSSKPVDSKSDQLSDEIDDLENGVSPKLTD